jgi:hypothetical protein
MSPASPHGEHFAEVVVVRHGETSWNASRVIQVCSLPVLLHLQFCTEKEEKQNPPFSGSFFQNFYDFNGYDLKWLLLQLNQVLVVNSINNSVQKAALLTIVPLVFSSLTEAQK